MRPIHNFMLFTVFCCPKFCISHIHKLLQSYQIRLPFLRTLSKKLHSLAHKRRYHIFTIITNAFHTTCFCLSFYNTIFFVFYSTRCAMPIIQNNYFNIRHVLNEQLNHSLEFSAPMSFKFVTNISIALPHYKVTSFRFSMTKLFFFSVINKP
ncbi:unnamed protein product [Chrysodeixis includens]|uniref:Uncharacterized protein n=1 Tax=Chrysodeixis includens TaxID=689277 RepID=A0A9N8L5U6_CHRIL|nr:unnamed protein product [Chrysodeixis includens]